VLVVLLLLLPRGWAAVGRVSRPVRDPSGAPAQQLFLTIWATRPNKPQPATTKGNLCSQSFALGRYALEIETPGLPPYEKTEVVMAVTTNAGLLRCLNTSPSRAS
jgi:hypothetical protein